VAITPISLIKVPTATQVGSFCDKLLSGGLDHLDELVDRTPHILKMVSGYEDSLIT